MTPSGRKPGHMPAVLALLAITAAIVLAAGCTSQQSQQVPVPTTQGSIAPAETTAAPGTPVPATTAAAGTPVPATTAQEGKKMVTFTEKDNGTTGEIAANTRFMVQLSENPTTGFSWNASTSPGLTVLSSEYTQNANPAGMTGVGGVHSWILLASGTGTQTFDASYRRPWENVTGNETAYSLAIRIVTI